MNLITSCSHLGAKASASSKTDPTLAVMRRTEVEGTTAVGEEGSAASPAVPLLALPSAAAHSSSVSVDMDMAEETERLKSTEEEQLSVDILRAHG